MVKKYGQKKKRGLKIERKNEEQEIEEERKKKRRKRE